MEYVIVGLFVCVFVGVMYYFVRKSMHKLEEMVSNLSDEQKNKLALTEVKFVEGKNNEWTQDGMIAEMTDKGGKYAIKVLWHNKVIQNATYDQIQYGDTSLSKKEVEEHNIKEGDFVKIYIAPEKTSGGFKIIFEI